MMRRRTETTSLEFLVSTIVETEERGENVRIQPSNVLFERTIRFKRLLWLGNTNSRALEALTMADELTSSEDVRTTLTPIQRKREKEHGSMQEEKLKITIHKRKRPLLLFFAFLKTNQELCLKY